MGKGCQARTSEIHHKNQHLAEKPLHGGLPLATQFDCCDVCGQGNCNIQLDGGGPELDACTTSLRMLLTVGCVESGSARGHWAWSAREG
eukprot:1142338-Pelagomonas_calceolata.AAC.5